MAAFEPDDAYRHPTDFDLLQAGFVHYPATYAEQGRIVEELASSGYTRITLQASRWTSAEDLHDAVSAAFNLPAHYGRNMDALADCLSDVAEGRYGWDAGSATGLLVSMNGFDRFAAALPEQAFDLVEAAARCSSYALLFGHRVLWLVTREAPR